MKLSYAIWVAAIERHRRRIILASVLVCIVSALSLTRLRLDIDVLGMLPRGTAAFDDFKAFVADFGELDELIVLIDGAPLPQLQKFADAFAGRLAALDTVATVHVKVDVDAVLAGMLGRYLYNYLPESDYGELQQRLTPEGIEAQVAANRVVLSAPFDLSAVRAVVQDPFGLRWRAAAALAESSGQFAALGGGYFAAPDGGALLMLVRPQQSAFDIAFSERLLHQVRQAEADTHTDGAHERVRVAYTGSYVYALEDAGTLRWDVARYTLLAFAGVLAVFYFGYRSLRILPFVAYPLVVTTLVTFAVSLLLFEELNAVSLSFAAILYGLSIDSAIYFFTRLLQERQQRPLRAAVTATLAGLGRANLAASTTSAAAFFVIGFSCLGAVSQLGFLTALGMLVTTLEFFTLYPALGFLFSHPSFAAVHVLETRRLARWADASSRRAIPVGAAAALLGLGLLFAARRVALDVTLTHLRPQDSAAVRVQDEIGSRFGEQRASGAVLVRGADLDQALEQSEEVARRLAVYRDEGLLRSVQSVKAVLPSARAQRARLDLYNQLPRAAAIETLRAALERHGFVTRRFQDFFAEFQQPRQEIVRMDNPALAPLAALIDHHVRARDGEYIVATYVQPSAGVSFRTVAERLRRDLPNVHFTCAARSLLEEELRAVLRRELARFFAFGLLGNLALLVISFGSVGTALAILAPVVLVVIALFAAMWAAGIALDPVNLIVTPLLFGIGVDYGVYIVARAREQGGVAAALRYAGRAVVVTSLTTSAGFGFLSMSRFPALATMGLLAGVALFLCLVLSIILLPALLALTQRAGTKDQDDMGEGTG